MPELHVAVPCDVRGCQDGDAARQVQQHPEIAAIEAVDSPPRKGTSNPGRVTTITCRLTFTVEWVAARMYQLTATKFMPLPKSETNMARKKKRKPRWAQMIFQSTRGVVDAGLAIEPTSLLS